MIKRWEIRENTLTDNSIYVLLVEGTDDSAQNISAELSAFCRLIEAKVPPFTHVFELYNITDDSMLEKIRIKIEGISQQVVIEGDVNERTKHIDLDLISPKTEILGRAPGAEEPSEGAFPAQVSEETLQEHNAFFAPREPSAAPKPKLPQRPAFTPQQAKPAFEPHRQVPSAPRREAPAAIPTETNAVKKDFLAESPKKEETKVSPTDIFGPLEKSSTGKVQLSDGSFSIRQDLASVDSLSIELENHVDVGDGTFINLSSAEGTKLKSYPSEEGFRTLTKGTKTATMGIATLISGQYSDETVQNQTVQQPSLRLMGDLANAAPGRQNREMLVDDPYKKDIPAHQAAAPANKFMPAVTAGVGNSAANDVPKAAHSAKEEKSGGFFGRFFGKLASKASDYLKEREHKEPAPLPKVQTPPEAANPAEVMTAQEPASPSVAEGHKTEASAPVPAPNPFANLGSKKITEEFTPQTAPAKTVPSRDTNSVFHSIAPEGKASVPIEEILAPTTNNDLSAKIEVDDIFAAETICEFYADPEETGGQNKVDEILQGGAAPAATTSTKTPVMPPEKKPLGNFDDFMDVPNLLSSSEKPATSVIKQEVPGQAEAAPKQENLKEEKSTAAKILPAEQSQAQSAEEEPVEPAIKPSLQRPSTPQNTVRENTAQTTQTPFIFTSNAFKPAAEGNSASKKPFVPAPPAFGGNMAKPAAIKPEPKQEPAAKAVIPTPPVAPKPLKPAPVILEEDAVAAENDKLSAADNVPNPDGIIDLKKGVPTASAQEDNPQVFDMSAAFEDAAEHAESIETNITELDDNHSIFNPSGDDVQNSAADISEESVEEAVFESAPDQPSFEAASVQEKEGPAEVGNVFDMPEVQEEYSKIAEVPSGESPVPAAASVEGPSVEPEPVFESEQEKPVAEVSAAVAQDPPATVAAALNTPPKPPAPPAPPSAPIVPTVQSSEKEYVENDFAKKIKERIEKQILSGEIKVDMTQDDFNNNNKLNRPAVPGQAVSPAPKAPSAPIPPKVNAPSAPRPAAPGMQPRPAAPRPTVNPPQMPNPAQHHTPVQRPVSNPAQQHAAPAPRAATMVDHTILVSAGQVYKRNNWPLEIPLNPLFTFDKMDMASNRFAHATAMSVIDNIGTMHNPFMVYGDSGTGKTHFLNAMGYELAMKIGQEKIFFTNGVRFSRGVQRYVEEGNMKHLEDFFSSVEVLIIDDIHLTAVNEHNREFISRVLNRFLQEKKQILISSKYPPESLARFEELVRFRLDQDWVSELKHPRQQHFSKIYAKMMEDAELGLNEVQSQGFLNFDKVNLGSVARNIKRAKVLSRRINNSGLIQMSYEQILNEMLAVNGENENSEIVKKDFADIVSINRSENTDWGNFGFFYPQDQADKFKWMAFCVMQKAKELGIKGGFNFALKSSYSTEHIISAAFKIANICDNKNLKGAIILGPALSVCQESIRDNFYDILTHMLEVMMIRCGIINAESIKNPSAYVRVLGDVLK